MKTSSQVQEFAKSLESWVSEAQTDEKRSEAAEKMIDAFKLGSTYLYLTDLNLTSLPDRIGDLKSLK